MSLLTCLCNPIGAPVRDITLSPDGAWAYVLAHHPHGAAAEICINLAGKAISAVVEVSESATQIVMSPDGTEIYVVERDGIAIMADHVGDVTAVPTSTPMLQAAAS